MNTSRYVDYALRAVDTAGINRIVSRHHLGSIKVLMLHSVSDDSIFDNRVTTTDFETTLTHLQRQHNVVRLTQNGEWIGLRDDKVNVLLTFDDGFVDNYTVAAPILEARGLSAVFFLISSCLRTGAAPAFATRKYGAGVHDALGTIDTRQARDLVAMGMTVGSHSVTHEDFTRMQMSDAIEEVGLSKKMLSDALGCGIELFAFPWGRCTNSQVDLATQQYKRVFTTKHGFNTPTQNVLCRNEVSNSVRAFAATSGTLDLLKGGTNSLRRMSAKLWRPDKIA